MHYCMELIIKPTDNIEDAVREALNEYQEDPWDDWAENNNDNNKPKIYDYYSIGGRFDCSKLLDSIGEENISLFTKRLQEENITVSGAVFGKYTLQPASQIDKVNKIWNELFPNSPIKECPLFSNIDNKYGLIQRVKDIYEGTTAYYFLFCYDGFERLISEDNKEFDRTFGSAMDIIEKENGLKPKDDYLVITVDLHC